MTEEDERGDSETESNFSPSLKKKPLGELSAEATRAAGRGRDAGCGACGGAAPKARCAKRGR